AFITVLIPELLGTRQRGFYCDDVSIQQPFYDHTIPMGRMTLVSLALFLIIPLAIEYLIVAKDESVTPSYRWGQLSCPAFVANALVIFGYSHIGFTMQVALTQIAKFGTGRLRPHFMDVCKPIGFTCTEQNQYITNYTCTGTNAHRIREVRLSFFSGHSSTAIYVALFIALYLESRLGSRRLYKRGRRIVQGVLIVSALVVCGTRVTDNFHHPTDVLVGIIFGAVFAVFSVS
ncbi:hypothetical protein PFISCL1PPCAC_14375, partial [Pristionchus fissidentatus]